MEDSLHDRVYHEPCNKECYAFQREVVEFVEDRRDQEGSSHNGKLTRKGYLGAKGFD